MIIIGLDPGTITGYATWSTQARLLGDVTSMPIHQAMARIASHPQRASGQLLVIFEDARQRKWFGKMDRQQDKYGAAVREGAGAAKRDAAIWDDFLTDQRIPFIAQAPRGTKRSADTFKALTQWQGRTNEHSRDAGLIVFGIDAYRAEILMGTAKRWAA